jgi:hypothetical protein
MVTSSAVNDNVISTTELKAFSDDDYYLEKWRGLQQDRSKFAGFNLFAALFGPVWCFYRKMYVLGSVILLAELLLPIIIGISYTVITHGHIINTPPAQMAGYFGTWIITRVGLGFLANIAYFRKAVKVIARANSLNVPNDIYLNIIRSAGGINFPAIFIPIAIYMAIRILTQS